jgi:GNAT superfamily N-acetyltransferase
VAEGVTVERVGEETLGELLPLVRGYCEFYEVSPTDEQLLELSRALLADPEREGVQLLARDDGGRAVGFATIYWSWATTSAERIGVMNDLFVAPEGRGTGAAEALIEACRVECAAHGAGKLTWQTAPDNERAMKVYDRVGANREQWVDYWLPVGQRAASE